MSDNNFRKGPHAARNKVSKDALDTNTSSVDERKTVVLDEDLENVSFDDKVWLYWQRNRTFLISTFAMAVAIVVGVQCFKMYQANSAATLATSYENASTNNTLQQFAQDNAGSKLGGLALLQTADKLFQEGKNKEAKDAYKRAQDSLKNTDIFGRAKLGEAFCAYALDKAEGKKLLEETSKDANANVSYRAQAAYTLAQAKLSEGDKSGAKKLFEEIAKNPDNGMFARMASEEASRLN